MNYIFQAQQILTPNQKTGEGGLWISGLNFAVREQNLKRNNIKAVCSVLAGRRVAIGQNINHIYVELEDHPDIDCEEFMKACQKSYTFIESNVIENKNVLVHCVIGASRSAAICCYYLSKKYNISMDDSLNYISKIRPSVKINQGFIRFLNEADKQFQKSKARRRRIEDIPRPKL